MQQIVSRGHTRPLTEISFVQDGPSNTLLVSSAHDKLPQVRNGETGDWIGSFTGHKGAVWSAKVDALTRTLAATASGDFSAKLWCATTGKELCEFKHKHVVKSVDFSRDSERIATGCQDGLMRIYQTNRPEQAATEFRVAAAGSNETLTKVNWLPQQDNLLVLGQRAGKVQLWDTRTSSASRSVTLAKAGGDVLDIEINPTHGVLLAVVESRVVFLSMADLSIVREYQMPAPMHFKEEGGASLSPDGTKFIAGGSDLWLREFDVQTGEVLQTFKGHHGPIRCVRYHPSGDVGASGSEDATIRMWGLNDRAALGGK